MWLIIKPAKELLPGIFLPTGKSAIWSFWGRKLDEKERGGKRAARLESLLISNKNSCKRSIHFLRSRMRRVHSHRQRYGWARNLRGFALFTLWCRITKPLFTPAIYDPPSKEPTLHLKIAGKDEMAWKSHVIRLWEKKQRVKLWTPILLFPLVGASKAPREYHTIGEKNGNIRAELL